MLKMKIAITSSGLEHIKRGVETWAKDLAYALKEKNIALKLYKGSGTDKNGFEKTISCIKSNSDLCRKLHRIFPPFSWHFGMGSVVQIEQTTFTVSLLPEIISKKFDIIHTQDAGVANILRIANRFGLIKSKVILAHGTEESLEFIKKFTYLQHLAPYHLEETKGQDISGRKDFVVPNFVDVERFSPEVTSNLRRELGIPPDAFVVLSVAAIKRIHKRIDYLINEISSLLTKKEVYLVIAGSKTEQTSELIRLGRKKCGNKVIFLTDYSHEKMPKVYAIADAFILCSLKEMMPITLLEALSSGLPCVCHKYPVHEWIIGKGGECIDMSKEGELARTIKKYFDESINKKVSENARKQAMGKFSKDLIINQIIDMYESVLKGQ